MPAQITVIAELGKLISGLQKHQPNQTLLIDGKSYTTAEVVQILQALIDALNATVAARAAYKQTVASSEALVAADRPIVRDIKQSIQIMYGNTTSVLSDYGLSPRKTTTRTATEKAAAADKALATRKARHTMGSKQKKGVTGASLAATISASAPVGVGGTVTTVGPVVAGTTSSSSSSNGQSGSSH